MNTLRLWEWGAVRVQDAHWPATRRQAVEAAARMWKELNALNHLPLQWGGADGRTLSSRNWVGVVEVDGGRIEICPKTDKSQVLDRESPRPEVTGTLKVLLRMLEATTFGEWVHAETAELGHDEISYLDLWALLLAKNLRPELHRGLPAAYQEQEEDLPLVRGKLLLSRQLSTFGDRIDRVHCRFTEFKANTPLLRLLKCACRFLKTRVGHFEAHRMLADCLFLLEEVDDVPPAQALREVERHTWTRGTERFMPHLELALKLLQGTSPAMGSVGSRTWVFLVDMNQVFEEFCKMALRDYACDTIESQAKVGCLLLQPDRLRQIPDFRFRKGGQHWIADAKWKVLDTLKPQSLDLGDLRQIITYAELLRRDSRFGATSESPPALALLCPSRERIPRAVTAWNGSLLQVVPVNLLDGWKRPGDTLPPGIFDVAEAGAAGAHISTDHPLPPAPPHL